MGSPGLFNDWLIKPVALITHTADPRDRSLALTKRALKLEETIKISKRVNDLQKVKLILVTSQLLVELNLKLYSDLQISEKVFFLFHITFLKFKGPLICEESFQGTEMHEKEL